MNDETAKETLNPMDFVKDGIAVFNASRKPVYVDDGLRRILGFANGESRGTAEEILERIQFSGAVGMDQVLEELLSSGEWYGEAAGLSSDDHAVYLEVSGRRLDEAASGGIGAILVFRNVTREKMMESRVLDSQQMELVEKLTRGIAHEFKNLLTIIMAYGSLLELQLKDTEDESSVQKIIETAERANDVTRRLVSITRRSQQNFESTDLQDVITEVNGLVMKALPSQVTVKTPEPRRLPVVHADAGALVRAIIHLALNACEAMPEGGTLDLDVREVGVTEEDIAAGHPASAPGKYVAVSVTDSGFGIDPQVKARIFEPFFTTKENGSGLGLSAVKKAVDDIHGAINVYSEPGKGTSVKLYLPVIGGQAAMSTVVTPPGTEKILVVDDDPAALSITRTMLEMAGYTVLTANSGEPALALLRKTSVDPDLVLLDVVMPDMNGDEVFREIREFRPQQRVVMSSGFPQSAVGGIVQMDLPMVSKPFTRHDLLSMVRKALDAPV